ncbi:hypothetical protein BLNAU_2532 [Blattamonas nauphoetae]|uniref:Rho-GAP domain-containing protein n=1 Tax=Blattamonas nauphoetae TaxID=2049346 RepID=A0ABQ9YG02_9EUKA|nr:hypothetical protein BLNAU_2532 [Blattamonas nauphoetae]
MELNDSFLYYQWKHKKDAKQAELANSTADISTVEPSQDNINHFLRSIHSERASAQITFISSALSNISFSVDHSPTPLTLDDHKCVCLCGSFASFLADHEDDLSIFQEIPQSVIDELDDLRSLKTHSSLLFGFDECVPTHNMASPDPSPSNHPSLPFHHRMFWKHMPVLDSPPLSTSTSAQHSQNTSTQLAHAEGEQTGAEKDPIPLELFSLEIEGTVSHSYSSHKSPSGRQFTTNTLDLQVAFFPDSEKTRLANAEEERVRVLESTSASVKKAITTSITDQSVSNKTDQPLSQTRSLASSADWVYINDELLHSLGVASSDEDDTVTHVSQSIKLSAGTIRFGKVLFGLPLERTVEITNVRTKPIRLVLSSLHPLPDFITVHPTSFTLFPETTVPVTFRLFLTSPSISHSLLSTSGNINTTIPFQIINSVIIPIQIQAFYFPSIFGLCLEQLALHPNPISSFSPPLPDPKSLLILLHRHQDSSTSFTLPDSPQALFDSPPPVIPTEIALLVDFLLDNPLTRSDWSRLNTLLKTGLTTQFTLLLQSPWINTIRHALDKSMELPENLESNDHATLDVLLTLLIILDSLVEPVVPVACQQQCRQAAQHSSTACQYALLPLPRIHFDVFMFLISFIILLSNADLPPSEPKQDPTPSHQVRQLPNAILSIVPNVSQEQKKLSDEAAQPDLSHRDRCWILAELSVLPRTNTKRPSFTNTPSPPQTRTITPKPSFPVPNNFTTNTKPYVVNYAECDVNDGSKHFNTLSVLVVFLGNATLCTSLHFHLSLGNLFFAISPKHITLFNKLNALHPNPTIDRRNIRSFLAPIIQHSTTYSNLATDFRTLWEVHLRSVARITHHHVNHSHEPSSGLERGFENDGYFQRTMKERGYKSEGWNIADKQPSKESSQRVAADEVNEFSDLLDIELRPDMAEKEIVIESDTNDEGEWEEEEEEAEEDDDEQAKEMELDKKELELDAKLQTIQKEDSESEWETDSEDEEEEEEEEEEEQSEEEEEDEKPKPTQKKPATQASSTPPPHPKHKQLQITPVQPSSIPTASRPSPRRSPTPLSPQLAPFAIPSKPQDDKTHRPVRPKRFVPLLFTSNKSATRDVEEEGLLDRLIGQKEGDAWNAQIEKLDEEGEAEINEEDLVSSDDDGI